MKLGKPLQRHREAPPGYQPGHMRAIRDVVGCIAGWQRMLLEYAPPVLEAYEDQQKLERQARAVWSARHRLRRRSRPNKREDEPSGMASLHPTAHFRKESKTVTKDRHAPYGKPGSEKQRGAGCQEVGSGRARIDGHKDQQAENEHPESATKP